MTQKWMSEAEGMSDIGGDMADLDMQAERDAIRHSRTQYIKDDRKRRLKNLAGTYVISAKGYSSGKLTFIQDPKISKGGYWTQFLSNAQGFSDLTEAKEYLRKLKYNNPKIGIVTANGVVVYV